MRHRRGSCTGRVVKVIVSDQPMTSTRQRRPDERDNRLSPVTRTTPSSSARATYAASYGVRFCRSSQQRVTSCRCGIRCSGSAKRSATAKSARRTSSCPATTCRRQTEATSRSISSGATRAWPRSPLRAASPSELSSARAGAKTLASTTITILPEDVGRPLDRHSPAGSSARAVEDLLDRRRGCLLDQLGSQVLLQRLMGGSRSLTQHCVGVLWDVLDLHAWHSAILALRAPFRK